MKHTTTLASLVTALTLATGCATTNQNTRALDNFCSDSNVRVLEQKILSATNKTVGGRSSADRLTAIADLEKNHGFVGKYQDFEGVNGEYSVVDLNSGDYGQLHVTFNTPGGSIDSGKIIFNYKRNRTTGKKQVVGIDLVSLLDADRNTLFMYMGPGEDRPSIGNADDAVLYATRITDRILQTKGVGLYAQFKQCNKHNTKKRNKLMKALKLTDAATTKTPATQAPARTPELPAQPVQAHPVSDLTAASGRALPENTKGAHLVRQTDSHYCGTGYANITASGEGNATMKAGHMANSNLAKYMNQQTGDANTASRLLTGSFQNRKWKESGERTRLYVERCTAKAIQPTQRYNQQR